MNSNKSLRILLFVTMAASATASASDKPDAKQKDKKSEVHERGWIGGEYKLARQHWSWFSSTETVVAFPKPLINTQKTGILITALSTNAPAYLAGLREGDLLLEIEHTRLDSLPDFRRRIDRAKPGHSLAVRAYRNGDIQDYEVNVGRETFRHQGILGLILPPIISEPNLKFNPGFSLIVLGLSWDTGKRTELGSAEQVFVRESSPQKYDVSNRHWRAWVALVFAEHDHQILSQEVVAR